MDNMPRGNQSDGIDLTPEENEVMRKCSSSSIWTHSLPAMVASSAFLQLLRYRGVTIKFWVSTGTIIGSGILGRLSALPGCMQEVVTKYPEGSLARTIEEMKARRKGMQGFPPSYQERYEPEDRSGMFESSTRPPLQAGPSNQLSGQTYDDLRRRNRDQYMESKRPVQSSPATPLPQDQTPPNSSYSSEPPSYSAEPSSSLYSPIPQHYDHLPPYIDSSSSPRISPQEESKIRKRKRVNQYGDEIED
ncbi:OCIA domain-containing protein 1 [Frankliniella fusca]|uniref:OCIA domain-containing protein 1 n=1 Tax=Frankliniella fusca TaxID=407009 RepID=A0AAE1LAX6_9NEOP|nr:OCIA domain-containing protein 1 [Frankliniella fusca]